MVPLRLMITNDHYSISADMNLAPPHPMPNANTTAGLVRTKVSTVIFLASGYGSIRQIASMDFTCERAEKLYSSKTQQ